MREKYIYILFHMFDMRGYNVCMNACVEGGVKERERVRERER